MEKTPIWQFGIQTDAYHLIETSCLSTRSHDHPSNGRRRRNIAFPILEVFKHGNHQKFPSSTVVKSTLHVVRKIENQVSWNMGYCIWIDQHVH